MSDQKLCFYVCEGCGPTGLFKQLLTHAATWARDGFPVEVRQPTCLLACRFKQVVKVLDTQGDMVSYSSVGNNGFRQFKADPLDELIEAHVPAGLRAKEEKPKKRPRRRRAPKGAGV